MPGILEFEIELCQKAIIAIAERKLSRTLTEWERMGVQRINSLLQLNVVYKAFNSAAYTSAEVVADLEVFTKQAMRQ